MPTAPTYGAQRADIAAVPGVRQTPNRTPQEYGAGFGEVVQQAGSLAEKVYIDASITRAQEAANAASAKLDAFKVKAATQRGYAAMGLSKQAEEEWAKIESEASAEFGSNGVSMAAWKKQSASMRNAFMHGISSHEAEQTYQAAKTTKDVTVTRTQEEAAQMYGTAGFDGSLEMYKTAVKDAAMHSGVAPGDADRLAATAESLVYSKAIDRSLDAKNFTEAKARFDKHKETIPAADRAKYEGIFATHDLKQKTYDVGIVAANAAIQKKPEIADFWVDGSGETVDTLGYANAVTAFYNTEANEGAGYLVIDKAIAEGRLPGNQREEAVAQMKNYIAAEKKNRADYKSAVLGGMTNEIDAGASVSLIASARPYEWASLNSAERTAIEAYDERKRTNRVSDYQTVNELRRLRIDPENFIRIIQSGDGNLIDQMIAGGLSKEDATYWRKQVQDAMDGTLTREIATAEAAIERKVIEHLITVTDGAKSENDLDQNKKLNALNVVRANAANARRAKNPNWMDPALYTTQAESSYKSAENARTAQRRLAYDPTRSDNRALIEGFSDPHSDTFNDSVSWLSDWASAELANNKGAPRNASKYATSLAVFTGKRPDQLDLQREQIKAAAEAARAPKTPDEIEREIINTRANELRTTPTLIGRAAAFVTDVPNIKEAFWGLNTSFWDSVTWTNSLPGRVRSAASSVGNFVMDDSGRYVPPKPVRATSGAGGSWAAPAEQ